MTNLTIMTKAVRRFQATWITSLINKQIDECMHADALETADLRL